MISKRGNSIRKNYIKRVECLVPSFQEYSTPDACGTSPFGTHLEKL
jgi:hypothetical protein